MASGEQGCHNSTAVDVAMAFAVMVWDMLAHGCDGNKAAAKAESREGTTEGVRDIILLSKHGVIHIPNTCAVFARKSFGFGFGKISSAKVKQGEHEPLRSALQPPVLLSQMVNADDELNSVIRLQGNDDYTNIRLCLLMRHGAQQQLTQRDPLNSALNNVLHNLECPHGGRCIRRHVGDLIQYDLLRLRILFTATMTPYGATPNKLHFPNRFMSPNNDFSCDICFDGNLQVISVGGLREHLPE